MSIADHATAADGQSLAGQDGNTQATYYNTWGSWAAVRWVLDHNHTIGQGDAPPAVSPADAVNNKLPPGTPCQGGSQCASRVCAPPAYLCSDVLVDPSQINPLLENPGVTATGGVSPTPPSSTGTNTASSGLNLSSLSSLPAPVLAGGAVLLLFLLSGGHRGGRL